MAEEFDVAGAPVNVGEKRSRHIWKAHEDVLLLWQYRAENPMEVGTNERKQMWIRIKSALDSIGIYVSDHAVAQRVDKIITAYRKDNRLDESKSGHTGQFGERKQVKCFHAVGESLID